MCPPGHDGIRGHPPRDGSIPHKKRYTMQKTTFNVLGFDVTKDVPSTVEEYDALAPKRANACLSDAISTTIYRGTSPVIRADLVEIVEKLTLVPRINTGTEEDPQWESEARYVRRAILSYSKSANIPETTIRANLLPEVQASADKAPFPVAESEKSGNGPAIGKRDLQLADKIIAEGKADAIAGKLATLLNRPVATDQKSLARAIADKRKADNVAAEAALMS